MTESQISLMETNTGQNDTINTNSNSNNTYTNKELANFVQNQQRNDQNDNQRCKRILLEMEYKNTQLPNDQYEIKQIAIEHGIKLIKHWITIKAIDGI